MSKTWACAQKSGILGESAKETEEQLERPEDNWETSEKQAKNVSETAENG